MMTNEELLERYPFLRPRNRWTGELMNQDEKEDEELWTELDDMPTGWRIAFGEQMCEELLEILKEANYVEEYMIVQIKEKYAELRWYDNGVPEKVWDKYRDWLYKYEELSRRTCIRCGKPATLISRGWISPYCDCIKESEFYNEAGYMPIKKFYKED